MSNTAIVSLVIWLRSELACLARRSRNFSSMQQYLLSHRLKFFDDCTALMRKRLPLSRVPKVVYLRGLNAYRKRAFNGFWRQQRSVRLRVGVWQLAALIRDQGSINRLRESSVVSTLTPSFISQSQLHDDEIHTRRLDQPLQGHQFVTDPALRALLASYPRSAHWTLIINGSTVGLTLSGFDLPDNSLIWVVWLVNQTIYRSKDHLL